MEGELFSYENGFWACLILNSAWTLVKVVPALGGYKKSNYRKVGYRISWSTGEPKELTRFYNNNWKWLRPIMVLFGLAGFFLFSMLSWVGFALVITSMVSNSQGLAILPEKNREFTFEVCNKSLSKKQMIYMLAKLNEYEDEDIPRLEDQINSRLARLESNRQSEAS